MEQFMDIGLSHFQSVCIYPPQTTNHEPKNNYLELNRAAYDNGLKVAMYGFILSKTENLQNNSSVNDPKT